jgi:DNA-binding IclR family transcriptional regulator
MARWLAVMEAFLERDAWGVRELATHTGLPRSSIHRVLHEMTRRELLIDADGRGQFQVGPGLARLSVLLAERLDVRRVARPVMQSAAAELGETVILALYSAVRRQFWAVDAVESAHPISYIWGSLRAWSDLHLGSSGKGILAFLPDAEREMILGALPDPVPGLRPLSVDQLRTELADARRRGYVLSRGERFPGAIGVSAPIRDAAGRVMGDLIISWPDNRTDPDKEAAAASVVVRSADAVSAALGYRA